MKIAAKYAENTEKWSVAIPARKCTTLIVWRCQTSLKGSGVALNVWRSWPTSGRPEAERRRWTNLCDGWLCWFNSRISNNNCTSYKCRRRDNLKVSTRSLLSSDSSRASRESRSGSTIILIFALKERSWASTSTWISSSTKHTKFKQRPRLHAPSANS